MHACFIGVILNAAERGYDTRMTRRDGRDTIAADKENTADYAECDNGKTDFFLFGICSVFAFFEYINDGDDRNNESNNTKSEHKHKDTPSAILHMAI
jgi:hypothetical protein